MFPPVADTARRSMIAGFLAVASESSAGWTALLGGGGTALPGGCRQPIHRYPERMTVPARVDVSVAPCTSRRLGVARLMPIPNPDATLSAVDVAALADAWEAMSRRPALQQGSGR